MTRLAQKTLVLIAIILTFLAVLISEIREHRPFLVGLGTVIAMIVLLFWIGP